MKYSISYRKSRNLSKKNVLISFVFQKTYQCLYQVTVSGYWFDSLLDPPPKTYHIQKQPPELFYKKAVLKSFAIFTGKHLCWILLLIKLQACNSVKKRLQHSCFPVSIARFLRTIWRTSANGCFNTFLQNAITSWDLELT